MLFSIVINDTIRACKKTKLGTIIVYADDILIVSRTRYALQRLFSIIECCLADINLQVNEDKCKCICVGRRFKEPCVPIKSLTGIDIAWADEVRYLGVYICGSVQFKTSPSELKKSFNRACNSILSKLLGKSSEDLILHLVKVKCLPVLLYGSEVCNYPLYTLRSLDFCLIRFAMKIFRTANRDTAVFCLDSMGVLLPSVAVPLRQARFGERLSLIDNCFCNVLL